MTRLSTGNRETRRSRAKATINAAKTARPAVDVGLRKIESALLEIRVNDRQMISPADRKVQSPISESISSAFQLYTGGNRNQ